MTDRAVPGTVDRLATRVSSLPRPVRWLLGAAVLLSLVGVNRLALVDSRLARHADAVAQQAEVLYVPDTRLVRLMSLGYDQAGADIMWVRTLTYFARHFTTDRRYPWLEFFIDQVLTLDPDFTKVYHWAGASVLYGRRFTIENIEQSSRFYQRALEHDPDNFEAAYRLGLNLYIEMPGAIMRDQGGDEERIRQAREAGLAWLERAANTPGAPSRVRTLVAAISSKLGKQQIALQYLIDLYIQTDDPEQKLDIKRRIEGLQTDEAADAMAREATAFEEAWKTHYPYVPPAVFALMGEPRGPDVGDVDWRTLLPGIQVAPTTGETDP